MGNLKQVLIFSAIAISQIITYFRNIIFPISVISILLVFEIFARIKIA